MYVRLLVGRTRGGRARLRGVATAAALCLGLACSAGSTRDDGEQLASIDLPDDQRPATGGATAASADLELLSEQRVTLRFGEPATLSVRLTDRNGEPIEGQPIGFALMGRARDASLDELEVATDADGRADNRLMAGEVVATFRVRISAPGAGDLYVDIRVSNAGFGTLLVDAPYEGSRSVQQRSVAALAMMECAEAMRMAGDPMTTLTPETGDAPAEFLALPAEVSYAVMASADGADGTVLARGCVDGVMLGADEQVRIAVPFEDEPLAPQGSYDAVFTLDTSAPSATLVRTMRDALELAIIGDAVSLETPAAEAGFLLDSLELALDAEGLSSVEGVSALLTELRDARANPGATSLERSLASQLELGAVGPRAAAVELGAQLGAALRAVAVEAQLSLDDQYFLSTSPQRWSTLPEDDDAEPVSIDVDAAADLSQAEHELARDALVLSSTDLPSALGALAAEVTSAITSTAEGEAGVQLRALTGCSELSTWLSAQSFDASACDAACVEMACARALARMAASARDALTAVDDERPAIRLGVELALTDDDGDLAVERIAGEMLEGVWRNPATTDDVELEAITGTLEASAAGTDADPTP